MTKTTMASDPVPLLDADSDGVGAHLLKLLTNGEQLSSTVSVDECATDYDGHVALTLDPGALADIAPMLDALMNSSQLFDVPALDFSDPPGDASAA